MSATDHEIPIEVWCGERKVSIYSDVVLRVWGSNMETEMSHEPRTCETVQGAFDWLYFRADNRDKQSNA
jgi:hypothetical protein